MLKLLAACVVLCLLSLATGGQTSRGENRIKQPTRAL